MKIFVYGTLMRGFSNHHLMKSCKFVGAATTKEKFALYVADFPFVTEKLQISPIQGEVYEVTDVESLKRLDDLEEHPTWYRRKPVTVVVEGSTGGEIEAELYFNEEYAIEGDVESVLSGYFRDASRAHAHLT